MPEIRRLCGAALTAALLLLSPGAQAHLLKLFASAENGQISGYVYFSGGAKVQQAAVNISDSSGALLGELKTDPQGAFSYRSQKPVDHLISASTLDGHAATWTISAAELGGQAISANPANSAAAATASRDNLDQRIEAAVARQVRPLREAIERQQEKARLQDIFGALGYIAGLAGLALWWRSRQPATKQD
ncbi:carboxypeptidase-like regulatory domain-containing protein [Marinobacterium jannaschii]|uniref:carboxypeptidase-like regulatory domain-containing protein n=1 Tax=Marinobacterium jannaschii TaxID=64970 RepID=UPI00048347B5|nr:carboxypeptidase-like regulatory domain-containing protein [Marinobacterium jannaschii]